MIFADHSQPDFRDPPTLAQGHIEGVTLLPTTRLNDDLAVAGVGQDVVSEPLTVPKETDKTSIETIYGVTHHSRDATDIAGIPAFNRCHWTIEGDYPFLLDSNGDEHRCALRTGLGPTNLTTQPALFEPKETRFDHCVRLANGC